MCVCMVCTVAHRRGCVSYHAAKLQTFANYGICDALFFWYIFRLVRFFRFFELLRLGGARQKTGIAGW